MTFGCRVIVKAVLKREGKYAGGIGMRKFWDRKELKAPREALYIGKRVLSNGKYYYEDGYESTESVAALVVVFSEREKPMYALPNDVQDETVVEVEV